MCKKENSVIVSGGDLCNDNAIKQKTGGNKKMKKRVIVSLLTAAMLASTCATVWATESEEEKVEISTCGYPTDEGALKDQWDALIASFEEKYPNVKITPDTYTFSIESFYPKAEAGLLPNFFQSWFTEANKIIEGGYAYDITDILDEKGMLDLINPAAASVVSDDEGRIYGLPSSLYCLGISVNMDLFEAAGLLEEDGSPMQPETWEELAEFAVKIKEATGKDGYAIVTSDTTGGWKLMPLAWSNGVEFVEQDEEGNWHATFNTPEMVETLQFISDLKWKYEVVSDDVLVTNSDAQQLFATGQVGMVISGNDARAYSNYEMDPEQYGMIHIPAGTKGAVSLMGGNINCVSNTSTEEQARAVINLQDFNGNGTTCDEDTRIVKENDIKAQVENGVAIGIYSLSFFDENSEMVAITNGLIDEYYNMRPNAVKYYNDSLTSGEVEMHTEVPVCAQDLYSILSVCIQDVLSDENADIEAIVEQANSDFQTNFLDLLD